MQSCPERQRGSICRAAARSSCTWPQGMVLVKGVDGANGYGCNSR
jgi:hypothetical protein